MTESFGSGVEQSAAEEYFPSTTEAVDHAATDAGHGLAAAPADESPLADLDAAVAPPNGFALMGLAPELVAATTDLGYTEPTVVQHKVIPL